MVSVYGQPNTKALERSISTTNANGKRLLEDAKYLFDWDRFPSAYALAVLAQEEFAKGLMLQLVADRAVPWVPAIRQSMAKHESKHLLALVLEWLPIFEEAHGQFEAWLERNEAWKAWHERRMTRLKSGIPNDPSDPEPKHPDIRFPPEVAKALNIYRHEQIERLRSGTPWTDEEWADGIARKIASGAIDRKKQSALYVHIGKTGEVGLHPDLLTRDDAAAAIRVAERFDEGMWPASDEYRKLTEVLPLLFSNLVGEIDE
jgi:AbiV family abortive infection protein